MISEKSGKKDLFLMQITNDCIRSFINISNMVSPNATGAIVAAKFRKIVRSFQTREAYSSSTARTIEELGVRHSLIFRRLVRKGVIVESGSGKYYLDKDRLEQYTQIRRKIVFFILLAIALAVLIANFSGAFSE
jgi:hypothetical protein